MLTEHATLRFFDCFNCLSATNLCARSLPAAMPAFAGGERVSQLLMTALYQIFFSTPAVERQYSRLFLSPPNSRNNAYYLPLAALTPAGHPKVLFYGERGDIQFRALVLYGGLSRVDRMLQQCPSSGHVLMPPTWHIQTTPGCDASPPHASLALLMVAG